MPNLTMSMTPYALQRTAAYRQPGAAPAPYNPSRALAPSQAKGYGSARNVARFPPAGQVASPYTTASSYTNGPTLLAAALAFAAGMAVDHFLGKRSKR